MRPEIREFLESSVDQRAWTRHSAQRRATWGDIETELDHGGEPEETPPA
jgi:hypothetical protein